MNKLAAVLKFEPAFGLSLTFLPVRSVALAQDSGNPPRENPREEESKIAYGAESDFTSGSAWRGLVISDRPVVSNAGWISKYGFVALLFGSMVSATDPISVLSIFKEVAVDAVRSVLTVARLTITIDSTRVMYGTSIAFLRLCHKSGRFQLTRQRIGVALNHDAASLAHHEIPILRVEVGLSQGAGETPRRLSGLYAPVNQGILGYPPCQYR